MGRLFAALSVLLLSACGSAQKNEPAAQSAGGETRTPQSNDPAWLAQVESGKNVFDAACGACHPDGSDDLGPSLIDLHLSVDDMTRQIREGSGKMKPIGANRLPDSDIPALMAYMSTLGAVDIAKPAP